MCCGRFRWSAAVLAVLLLVAPSIRAQKTDKDVQEVERYTLTMDAVTRGAQVMQDAQAAEKADPSLKKSLESDVDASHDSLDQMAARLAGSPALVGILKKNGFTPREFLVMTMAMIQASLATYAKPKEEPLEQYAAKVHANPANLVFVQQHAAELQAMQKRTGGAEKKDADGGSGKSDDADGGETP